MDYPTMKEAAVLWGTTSQMANYYCTSDKIPDAMKKGDIWLIPVDSQKPIDGRTTNRRKTKYKGGGDK